MSLRKKVIITNESETYDVVVRSPNADGGDGARARADPRTRALGYRDARRRDDATMTTTRESVDLARARGSASRRDGARWRERCLWSVTSTRCEA